MKHTATGILKSEGDEFLVLEHAFSHEHKGQYFCAKRFAMTDEAGKVLSIYRSPAWLTIFGGYIRWFAEPKEVEIEE